MAKLYFLLVLLLGNSAFAEEWVPVIPVQISDVKTRLIKNEHLIRIIEFNTEMEPKLVFERLSRPVKKVLEKRVIEKVKLGNRVIRFKDSAAMGFESVDVDNNKIIFSVYYAYPGKGGGSVDFDCHVQVGNRFSEPVCHEK